MIQEIRGKILAGFRGNQRDVEAVAECTERLSQLVMDLEEVRELEARPLLTFEKGFKTVDARVKISPQ